MASMGFRTHTCFLQRYSDMVIPSSGVSMVISILGGPTPTDVLAATVTMYEV